MIAASLVVRNPELVSNILWAVRNILFLNPSCLSDLFSSWRFINLNKDLYTYTFLVTSCEKLCLFVCPFVSNKRQNGWTDQAQIFCGISHDHREGLWMMKIKKKLCWKAFYFCKNFLNLENPQIFFIKSAKFFFSLFFNVTLRTCSQLR